MYYAIIVAGSDRLNKPFIESVSQRVLDLVDSLRKALCEKQHEIPNVTY
jgi:hypothetical protein